MCISTWASTCWRRYWGRVVIVCFPPPPCVLGRHAYSTTAELLTSFPFATEEERKPLASIFSKLYVTANADLEKLRTIQDLVNEAVDDKVLTDAPSRNSLLKLQAALAKVAATAAAAEPDGQAAITDGAVTPETQVEEAREVEEVTIVDGMRSSLAMRPKREHVDHSRDSLISELLEDDEDGEDATLA